MMYPKNKIKNVFRKHAIALCQVLCLILGDALVDINIDIFLPVFCHL